MQSDHTIQTDHFPCIEHKIIADLCCPMSCNTPFFFFNSAHNAPYLCNIRLSLSPCQKGKIEAFETVADWQICAAYWKKTIFWFCNNEMIYSGGTEIVAPALSSTYILSSCGQCVDQ